MGTLIVIFIAILLTILTLWLEAKIFGTTFKDYMKFMSTGKVDFLYHSLLIIMMLLLYAIIGSSFTEFF